MFTGLIEEMGTVRSLKRQGESLTLTIGASTDFFDLKVGDSISVSGSCLTATKIRGGTFMAELSGETLARTTHKDLKIGDAVNLERPLRPTDRLGGHFVTGHVDAVGIIQELTPWDSMFRMTIQAPPSLYRYLCTKGSVAVDGVSLTVNELTVDGLRLVIIPHTASVTTLGLKRAGEKVNLEADILAKYVEGLLRRQVQDLNLGESPVGEIDRAFLASHGFLK